MDRAHLTGPESQASGDQGQENPAHEEREECQVMKVLPTSAARRVLESAGSEYREVGVTSKSQPGPGEA